MGEFIETFADLEKFVDDWLVETDDLEDTFQFQAKEVDRLQKALDANVEKVKSLKEKQAEAAALASTIENDICQLKQMQTYLEYALPCLERNVELILCRNQPIDGARQTFYPLIENIFSKFTYCKDLFDIVHVESENVPKDSNLGKIVRLLDLLWSLLQQIEAKISKMERCVEKIECHRRKCICVQPSKRMTIN